MDTTIAKTVPIIVSILCSITLVPAAMALNDSPQPNYQHTYQPPAYQPSAPMQQGISFHDYINSHPKLRSTTIGAGVGTAAGAVTGLITGRGILRGAVVGAGAGAGTGYIRSTDVMQRHPIVKNIATGSMIGLGLGLAGGRMPGTAMRTTMVGGATGMATGLLIHGL